MSFPDLLNLGIIINKMEDDLFIHAQGSILYGTNAMAKRCILCSSFKMN